MKNESDMKDFVRISGFFGPVTDSGFIGCFKAEFYESAENYGYPNSIFMYFDAANYVQQFNKYCILQKKIPSITYRMYAHTSNPGMTISWKDIFVERIVLSQGPYWNVPLNFIGLQFSYSPTFNSLTAFRLNAPVGSSPSVALSRDLRSSTQTVKSLSFQRFRPL